MNGNIFYMDVHSTEVTRKMPLDALLVVHITCTEICAERNSVRQVLCIIQTHYGRWRRDQYLVQNAFSGDKGRQMYNEKDATGDVHDKSLRRNCQANEVNHALIPVTESGGGILWAEERTLHTYWIGSLATARNARVSVI